ncbi:MAG: twin-arginine translocation signal domain-containing protein, partial [Bacteroidetes bacterium]|nr:twin-arginine translocation signal domain-containing protein [Bacteroidota bacterium]
MSISRRNFLKAAGSLTIGFCLGSKPGPEPGATDPGLAIPSPTPGPIPNRPTGLPPGPIDPPTESLINAWLEVL